MSVLLDGFFAEFLPDARLLDPAERHGEIQHAMRIDPNGSGAKITDKPMGLFQIASPNAGSEPEFRLVGPGNDFAYVSELGRRQYRPENLLAHDAHVRFDVAHDGWVDVGASRLRCRPADQDLGTFGLTRLNIGQYPLLLGR